MIGSFLQGLELRPMLRAGNPGELVLPSPMYSALQLIVTLHSVFDDCTPFGLHTFQTYLYFLNCAKPVSRGNQLLTLDMPPPYTPSQKNAIAQFVSFTHAKDSIAARVSRIPRDSMRR